VQHGRMWSRGWGWPLRAALAVLLALAPAGRSSAEWVDWIAEASSGFEYDSNLNFSAFGADEESDFAWRIGGRAGRVFQVSETTRLSLAAFFESALQLRFDELNRVRVGGEAAITHKLGVGPDRPVLRMSHFVGWLEVADDVRSSFLYEADVDVSKRFGPRLDGSLFARFELRDGRRGKTLLPTKGSDVWDQRNWELGIRTHYLLRDALLLSAGYRYRRGEFDSFCTTENVDRAIMWEGGNLKAIAVDDVFGGCVYRLGGDVHAGSLNLNYGLGRRFSVDLGYELRRGQGRVLVYWSHIVSLSLLFRY
jgi:hypothetical protein